MMKKLIEFYDVPNADIVCSNMAAKWGDIEYNELSIILVNLRFLYFVHQTHHWISKGDNYYGDHLLFQRLYEAIVKEIDSVAERAVGLGSENNVNLVLQSSQLFNLVQGFGGMSIVPQPDELARRSLSVEKNFLQIVETCVESLKQKQQLTRGLDNLVAGIEDTHETHVYLLTQRVS